LRIFRVGYLIAGLALLAPSVSYADDDSGAGSATADQQQPVTDDTGNPSDQDTTNATPTAPGPPHDFASGVAALNADSFDDKIAAVNYLGGLNDPRGVTVLQALSDDNLFAASDNSIVYKNGDTYRDAVSGKPVPDLDPSTLSEVIINNRLRGVLEGVLGQLTLLSPDPKLRIAAAQAMASRPTADSVERLTAALDQEKDPSVRQAMRASLSLIDLGNPDRAKRLDAIKALSGSTDPTVKGQLEASLAREQDPDLRKAAESAISSITTRLEYVQVGANLFEGISLGSILLLAAIGLSVTFGVMGVINMAHGEMIMLGAYSAFVVQQLFHAFLPSGWVNAYLVVAVPVAFLVTAAIGIALERTVIRFLYGRPLETLLSTWGISLILQQGVRTIFGPDNQAVANPNWMTGGMPLIGGFTLTWNRLVIIGFCFMVIAALAALLRYSSFGLHMRAVSQNRPMAAAMGIRTGRIDALTFGLGSGVAGIAGVALSQIGNVSPNLGQIYIVNCFMVVVFGGVGSLWGTLVGALSLGVATKFIEPWAGAIVGQILVLVFIILFIQRRPRGLFALKGRTAES
jgi:urea transport system permease protein